MTPAQTANSLFTTMPQPVSFAQLEEYGIDASETGAAQISREILSLNLYWILAAIDAHIPLKYQNTIRERLFESIKTTWWQAGQAGTGSWEAYTRELDERRALYGRLVDQERMSHMAVCAATASLIEDLGIIESDDRQKLLVLLIDYAPATEYGRLLEDVG